MQTRSAEETRDFAAALALRHGRGPNCPARAARRGQDAVRQGLRVGLGVTEVVNSPSFTLMAEYAGRLPLFHQDLYRLDGAEEAIGGGLVDERQLDGVTLIEWAERLPAEIDPGAVDRRDRGRRGRRAADRG